MPSGNTPTTWSFARALDVSRNSIERNESSAVEVLFEGVGDPELEPDRDPWPDPGKSSDPFGGGEELLLGFRRTGMAPVDERIAPPTGFTNIVDFAQNERWRRCGMVAAGHFKCKL